MKAIEFPAKIKNDSIISVPKKFKKDIPVNKNARVIILFDDRENENEWNALSLDQFFKGYNGKDSAYDKL